ncbi:unnamed protein product [Arabidopsis arenosa]|uniref:DC1 domain-containing protein n=1 Tax=Arabidopsis arenosa TaxID=38785 RepID=A0A8S2AR91_ARAAE|nr:unnamed protein product [Arabidopsis arenosa]
MESEGVSLPLIHNHVMTPWNDLREGDCCGRFEAISDGYYCEICDFFLHKKCGESSEYLDHPSHSVHTLQLQIKPGHVCDLCDRDIVNLCYNCEICDFDVDLYCATNPPPDFIDMSETHQHKLTLLKDKELNQFNCNAKCGELGYGFPYKCHECDLNFHLDCVWNPSEAKHSSERYQRLRGKLVSFLEENVLWIRVNLLNATNVAKQRSGNKFVENANKRAPNYIVIVAAKHLFLIRIT